MWMLDERGRIQTICKTELETNIIMAGSVKLGLTRLVSTLLAVVLCSEDPYPNCWHPKRAAILNVKTDVRNWNLVIALRVFLGNMVLQYTMDLTYRFDTLDQ